MFTSDSLKIYRKFFILAVMIGGLVFATTVNERAKASFCCSICFTEHSECMIACYNPNPGKTQECIEQICDPAFAECTLICDNWSC